MNQGVRGGKVTELKKTVDAAVQSCPTVRQVFVAMRTENPVVMTARDVAMEEVREQSADQDSSRILMQTALTFPWTNEELKNVLVNFCLMHYFKY